MTGMNPITLKIRLLKLQPQGTVYAESGEQLDRVDEVVATRRNAKSSEAPRCSMVKSSPLLFAIHTGFFSKQAWSLKMAGSGHPHGFSNGWRSIGLAL
jgi:hypothetical protein